MITKNEQAEMTAHTLEGSLDVNGKLPLKLSITPGADGYTLEAEVDLDAAGNRQFRHNIADLSSLCVGGKNLYFKSENDSKTLRLRASVSRAEMEQNFDIRINDVPVGKYIFHGKRWHPVDSIRDWRLTVSETRMLSFPMTETQLAHLPYPRNYAGHLHEYRMPITDLHTHLSSQLSTESLIDLAMKRDLAYPCELLEEAGIDYSGLPLHPVHAFKFNPSINNGIARECEKDPAIANPEKLKGVKLRDLPDTARRTLMQKMSIPFDGIYGPDDFDSLFYRFRNPLEKNPVLAHDKILQVAADYKRQGIQYAELSTGAMIDDPGWLREAVPAIEEAERRHGVKLRLLAGIPRTSSPDKVARLIERIKFVAQCPYVVGVDFLGYEANKTGDFGWALYNLARWARRLRNGVKESDEFSPYKDDFILRVHAGENNENINNVNEAIEIAKKFKVSMRIGHAVYANYTPDLLRHAKEAGIVMESIIPSNIALNNLHYPHESSIGKWVQAGVDFVEGTDGAGAYQLSVDQLTRDALHAGLTPKDLEKRHHFEEAYIRQRQRIFDDKKSAFEQNYPSFDVFMKAYEAHCREVDKTSLPTRLAGKTPILIAGASGSSWIDIQKQDEEKHKSDPTRTATQISTAMRMLVEMLDPNKVYFATGRVKDRGVEKELDKAIDAHDASHWRKDPPFDMIATTSRGDGAVSIANGVTWVNAQLHGKLQNVVRQVVDFLTTNANVQSAGDTTPTEPTKGCYAMFIGGKSMTSEFIRYAREKSLAHGLVKGPVGCADKETARAAADGKETIAAGDGLGLAEAMVKAVYDNLGPGVFNEHYRVQMKDESSARRSIAACYDEKISETIKDVNKRAPRSESHAARVR